MATIGPTLEKLEDIQKAIAAGAAWFRLPCGYRQRPHLENAQTVRAAAAALRTRVQLLLDLPSSRPRTGTMPEVRLAPGERALFWDPSGGMDEPAADVRVHIPLPGLSSLLPKLKLEHRMLFCDGRITFVVDDLKSGCVLARMEKGEVPLKSSNSLHLPDCTSPFAVVTQSDCELMEAFLAAGMMPDWIAISMVGSAEDMVYARHCVSEQLGRGPKLMAKFETEQATRQVGSILEVSDGVMVARGDLGLAVGYIRLPEVQEILVAAARAEGKPVIVATQALEVYAETGIPQRAELSDLSLIARQRADAVMLGKETVFSPRPIDCIRFATEVLTHETRRFEKMLRPRNEKRRLAKAIL